MRVFTLSLNAFIIWEISSVSAVWIAVGRGSVVGGVVVSGEVVGVKVGGVIVIGGVSSVEVGSVVVSGGVFTGVVGGVVVGGGVVGVTVGGKSEVIREGGKEGAQEVSCRVVKTLISCRLDVGEESVRR
jgi:hypothetical protein